MTATILDGKALSQQLQAETAEKVTAFTAETGIEPKLSVVLVGDNPASQVYVRNKQRACKRTGIASELHQLPAATSQADLLALIDRLNNDSTVHGILVQLPLPAQIDDQAVLDAIAVLKDVDAFHPENVGLLSQGRPRFLPCTPHGVLQILKRSGHETAGKEVVIVGRSEIVGKPLAAMLVQRDSPLGPSVANATVTVCHSRTADLPAVTRRADVLIVAIGKPRFVTAEMVKPGAVVIDVGINRAEDGLCGDVDFDSVAEAASAITPVPGGVGPLTIAMLLENTLTAARLIQQA